MHLCECPKDAGGEGRLRMTKGGPEEAFANASKGIHEFSETKHNIMLLGVTGAGKSALCNFLLEKDVCDVESAVTMEPVTRSAARKTTNFSYRAIGMPGLGHTLEDVPTADSTEWEKCTRKTLRNNWKEYENCSKGYVDSPSLAEHYQDPDCERSQVPGPLDSPHIHRLRDQLYKIYKRFKVGEGGNKIEFVRLTVIEGQGNVPKDEEKIHDKLAFLQEFRNCGKKELQAFDLLHKSSHSIRVVYDQPGIGKTTLLTHVCRALAMKEADSEYTLVLYFPLRNKTVSAAKTLEELLAYYYSEDEEKLDLSELKKSLENSEDKQILFIFDGVDEVWEMLPVPDSSVIQKILAGNTLPHADVIVSSRPGSLPFLQRHRSSFYEIHGFDQASIERYIKDFFKGTPEKAEKMMEELHSHPDLLGGALLRNKTVSSAKTLKELLTCGVPCQVDSSVSRLIPEIKGLFESLGALAYEGIMKNPAVFVFDESDIRRAFCTLPPEIVVEESIFKGLLVLHSDTVGYDEVNTFNFSRTTNHNVFVTWHICQLPEHDQLEFVRKYFFDPKLAVVVQFYSGLTGLSAPGVASFLCQSVSVPSTSSQYSPVTSLSLHSWCSNDDPSLLYLFHSLHESQNSDLCQKIVQDLSFHLFLTSHYILAISYISEYAHLKHLSFSCFLFILPPSSLPQFPTIIRQANSHLLSFMLPEEHLSSTDVSAFRGSHKDEGKHSDLEYVATPIAPYEFPLHDEDEEPKTVAVQETHRKYGLEESESPRNTSHDPSNSLKNGWKDFKSFIPQPTVLPRYERMADRALRSTSSTKFPNVKKGKSENNLADFENTSKFKDVQPLSRLTVQHGIDQHDTSASTSQLEDIGAREDPLGQEEVNSSPGVPTLPGQAVHVATGSSKNKGSSGYGTASHPQSNVPNAQYPSSVEKSDIIQEPAEVVTDNSAENVVVSHRGQAIAESLMQQDNCMVHIPTAAIPDTAHKTALVLGLSNSKSVIKILKEYIKTKPELNLKPSVFLANLHLQDVLKLKELTDIPSYLIKRSRLECVFKKLPPASKLTSLIDEEKAEAVVSSLKWLEKEQTDSLKLTLVSNRRKGWNDLKDSIRAVDMVFLPTLISKLGISIQFKAEPALSEFVGILDELSVVHRNWGLHNITKSQVVHALFVSSASTELLDSILLEDLPEKVSCVTISKVQKYADLYGATKEGYERFLAVILDDVSHKRDRNPLKVLPALPKSPSSVTHCLAVWLAVRAESPSSAVTWEEFVEMTRNLGLDESIIVREQRLLVATSSLKPLNYEHNAAVEQTDGSPSNESKHLPTSESRYGREPARPDRYPSPAVRNDIHLKPSEEHHLSNRFELSSTPSNLAVQKSSTSSSHSFPRAESSHNRVSEEQLLSRKLDPGNPESVMAHAKAVYLTGDYNRTREILEHFNHHLSVEGIMLRAKLFGLGITHYRQKHYPQAVQHLNELEKVAVEHHAAGDVMLSNIYRGECHLAMEKYQGAYDMFNKAKTVYSTDHVAHLYGIVILSKTSVVIKAATCQKHLRNIIAARDLFQKAVEMAVVVRKAAEEMSTSSHVLSDARKPLYKDEIAARTSLGNLHQNMSNCPKAVEEYKLALQLQKKLDSKCTTYGWAEGNLGNALVGAHKVKEAIPHLERAYEAAKKYQRDYTAVGRTASNLGSAYQSNKQYKEAEEHFEIALGHAVYCRDAIGQARSLGNIGNVKSAQGKHMDALRCYTETLSLDCDITANIAAYQNRANVYIDLARELAGGNDWDEVSSDVEAVQPKEVQSSEIPIQECTQPHGTGSMRLQLVAPEGSYIKLPLDDEQDILSNEQSLLMSSSGSVRRTGSIQQQPLTAFDALGPDDLKVRHRKYYLQKAKDDLEKSTKLIEERFNTIKGEGTTSMALSLFEVNAKGFYNLQKVLTLLGDHQGALQVAEQNRARNLGEILWKKKQNYGLQHRDLPSPFGLKNIWNFVNREKVPVVVLSYIQQSSTMLVHIVFPEEEGFLWRGLPGGFPSGQSGMLIPSTYISEMGFSRNAVDILSTHQSEESEPFRIPSSNYCFMKIDLPKEYFIAKRYGSLARLVDEEPIAFEQYVQKTLMDYLNQKDVELFTSMDFQDDESPLTVLFEKFARRFIEEIEQRWPTGREFVVVADQTAHFLPWPLLQDESTKVFLGDRYRVRTYPSLLTMGLMNHQGVEVIELPSQDRFLIIGNPTIPKFEHNGKEITLGRLPHAETEAVQVAHILEANPLLREMATKPTVEYRLQTAQIIHVATHASAVGGYLAFASSIPIVNTARPIDSKDALLFIDDIQKLRINASLVVLSACDSARGQLVNEGVNSIARAFLAAGAQSVLVSLVRVPDKSASIFMSLFYRFLTHNEFTTSEAIQKSSMVIRCIKSLSQHIHWGGYRLVGRDIRMKYNEECEAAKVAKLLGETSAFPRMKILQELEKAIFRQDRTPPRDVVVVKGMMVYDPAEVVKDFVAKRFKLFPGGVFWYNCNTPELLQASVQSILPHSQTIRKVPPKQTKVPENKKRSLDSSPLFEEHYRLIILDNPYSFEECVSEIKDINDQEVDIIVIGSMEADRDSSLTKFAHSELIRGCTSVEVEDIDRYTAIQRMAYQLLCKQDFCPYEEDYDAFETIVRFTRGCTSLVKVFEGLLATKEKGIVQKVARDIEAMKDIVIEYDDEHTTSSLPPSLSSHRPMSTLASLSSAIKETGRKVGSHGKKPKESKKTESLVKNGLITADTAKRLSKDDYVLLSEGLEKLPRIMDSMNNFLTVQLTPESHFILQSLSFISQFSFPTEDSHPESSFCFPEGFITTLATLVAPASRAGSPKELVEELKRNNLLRPYPQPVLYPLEKTSSESSSLLYIPDVVVKSVTYEMDDADFAFAFNTLSVANHQVNGVHSNFIYQPVSSAIDSLKGKFDFTVNSLANGFVNNQPHVPQICTNTPNKHYPANYPNGTQPPADWKMSSREGNFDHSTGSASHREPPTEWDSSYA